MVAFLALSPGYVFIASAARGRAVHAPATALDDVVPLWPAWSLVYGALYMCLLALPVFVVRHDALIRRTVWAYLTVWIAAYACFVVYPTVAPRPDTVAGDGFAAWGLRVLYDADPPYNCFPSLHVAHSFVSALACHRVHRGLGRIAVACAALVALSTLFTKQHYAADVVAGTLMGLAAHRVFLRGVPRDAIPEHDRRLAPVFALLVLALAALGLAGIWVAYRVRGGA
jgi:membrane-associated phospholipid phosphatase